MAIINYTDQLKYAGKGYLDSKMMPVKTYDDLKSIPLSQRFEGYTAVVLNDGNPQDYWLVGGISNSCWVPKTATSFNELKLVLEEGFLKLKNAEVELGEAVNLNDFFPQGGDSDDTKDLYIESVDYTDVDGNNNIGIFMCFTYSDSTKKYLNMSQFLSQTYDAGNGIVINGNVISIDSAITGNIETLETEVKTINSEINTLKGKITSLESKANEINTQLENKANNDDIKKIENDLNKVTNDIAVNQTNINTNTIDIAVLKERVNALSSNAEGSTPDGLTIGITNDEQKALYVKVLNKDGNILSVESENGESGLCAFIPFYCEDEEINE